MTSFRRKSFNSNDWSKLIYALLGFFFGNSNVINVEPLAAVAGPLLGV